MDSIKRNRKNEIESIEINWRWNRFYKKYIQKK